MCPMSSKALCAILRAGRESNECTMCLYSWKGYTKQQMFLLLTGSTISSRGRWMPTPNGL